MFTKITMALAIILGVTSGALAATTQQHSPDPGWQHLPSTEPLPVLGVIAGDEAVVMRPWASRRRISTERPGPRTPGFPVQGTNAGRSSRNFQREGAVGILPPFAPAVTLVALEPWR